MGMRHKFKNSVISVLKHNKDGSYRTRDDREAFLISMADQIHDVGFQLVSPRQIKAKHIWQLRKSWTCGAGTMKNRMSHIRWLMRKLGKESVVPSNDALEIDKRQYVTNQDKSRTTIKSELNQLKDERMQLMIRSQELFGLRPEESLKIQPRLADLGDFLHVTKTKGGRERFVPIRTEEQRQWLTEAKHLTEHARASLIPVDLKYKTYASRFYKACDRAGINGLHGHRHMYVHRRFEELTGYACPAKGGPRIKDLEPALKELDKRVRTQLAFELGHSRQDVTKIYLGR